MTRRGFTLIELMVFSAIALLIIGSGWSLLTSGSIVGSTTSEGLVLQKGVRNFMENLVKDVNAAVVIAEPHGTTTVPGARIVLWVFNDEKEDTTEAMVDPGKRIEFGVGTSNGGYDGAAVTVNPYPFANEENPTQWHLPVTEVTYVWDQNARTVTRRAVEGDLQRRAPAGSVFFEDYEFVAGSSTSSTDDVLMAEHIESLEVYPFGFDETAVDAETQLGTLRPTSELPDFVTGLSTENAAQGGGIAGFVGPGTGAPTGSGERVARTAMLLVKVKAVFDYASDRYRDPELEIATKIYSYAKISEHVHFPYFSSVDDDLRY